MMRRMKFFATFLVWLIMAAVLATGIVMAVHGKAWLLVASSVAFVVLFAKFGCLEGQGH